MEVPEGLVDVVRLMRDSILSIDKRLTCLEIKYCSPDEDTINGHLSDVRRDMATVGNLLDQFDEIVEEEDLEDSGEFVPKFELHGEHND